MRQNMCTCLVNTRTFHLAGSPPACPEIGRSGSTFPSEGSCVMQCTEQDPEHTQIKRVFGHALRDVQVCKIVIHTPFAMSSTSAPEKAQRVRTRSIKPMPCGDAKDDAVYRE